MPAGFVKYISIQSQSMFWINFRSVYEPGIFYSSSYRVRSCSTSEEPVLFDSDPIVLPQQSTSNSKQLLSPIEFNGTTHMLRYIKIIIESSTWLSQGLTEIPTISLTGLI